ncbi:MAG: DUF3187 family protein [Mariprofundales bacterium]|nr:DUF3187 family protein [Mariprofundales bacterium]
MVSPIDPVAKSPSIVVLMAVCAAGYLLPCIESIYADESGVLQDPLPVVQQNPVMMRHFNPTPVSAYPLESGGVQLRLQGHYSSLFLADQLPAAQRYLADMELFVAQAALRYGLGYGSDLEVSLPLLRPSAGVLDSALHRYHRALGLPNGGRELRPNNRFGYLYGHRQGGWRGSARWELGSVQLTMRSRIYRQPWALLLGVRLPTAGRSRGWGADGVDIAAGTVVSWQRDGWSAHAEGWWVAPVLHHDRSIVVGDYLRVSTTLGLQVTRLSSPFNVLLQIQGGGSPYRQSGVAALDQSPWLISVGVRLPVEGGWQWSATFVENITQRSTQDFGISLGLTMSLFD